MASTGHPGRSLWADVEDAAPSFRAGESRRVKPREPVSMPSRGVLRVSASAPGNDRLVTGDRRPRRSPGAVQQIDIHTTAASRGCNRPPPSRRRKRKGLDQQGEEMTRPKRFGRGAMEPGAGADALTVCQRPPDRLHAVVGHGLATALLGRLTKPARMRSRIMALSNSAKTESVWDIIRPLGVEVSALLVQGSTRRPMPLPT